jgi:EAL domain-containing protein (putative c-di-GMP-specific phosphodiesterase class I)
VLQQLRSLGVRIVLDDFGTGYSSLAYLRQLPLDTIKVDRSFVTDLDVRDPNVGIIRAVVSLAHGLGITVVAEGIETDEQARRLRELGCDMGQGYAWAHPAEPIRVGQFVTRRLESKRQSRKNGNHTHNRARRPRAESGIAARLSVGRRTAAAGTGTG